MTTTATTARMVWPSPSIPSPSSSSVPASGASSSIDTPSPSVHAPPPPLPLSSDRNNKSSSDDLEHKMVDFRRYLASRSSSGGAGPGPGPDLILNVSEYATFLPRPLGIPSLGSSNSSNNRSNDWTVPPSPPRTISGYAAGFGPLLGPNGRSSKITYHQCAPASPSDMLRESTEMLSKLPSMMSPTIPTWTVQSRPMLGGKQPGKVPAMPPGFAASSDDSASDSDRDSDDNHSSAIESGSVALSEADSSPQHKSIGRKTAQRRNSKAGSVGGKRLARPTSEITRPSEQCCCLLSHEQSRFLPHRAGKGVLSKSPAVIKINIPSFLLPELVARLKALGRNPTHGTKLASSTVAARSLSPHESPSSRNTRPVSKKYFSENEGSRRSAKRDRRLSDVSISGADPDSDLDSGSDSDSGRSATSSKHSMKDQRRTKPDAEQSRESGSTSSPALDCKRPKNGRLPSISEDEDSKGGESLKDGAARNLFGLNMGSRRMHSDSGTGSPEPTMVKARRKSIKDETRDSFSRERRGSKDDASRPSAVPGKYRDERDRTSRRRSRGHSRSSSIPRHRSRSRSHLRRQSRDRNSAHDGKPSRNRRDYEDDPASSKSKQKRNSSQEHTEKSSKMRREKSRSRSLERGGSREKRRDRKRQRSRPRSRSRERSDGKRSRIKEKDRNNAKSAGDGNEDGQMQRQLRPSDRHKSESHRGGHYVGLPPKPTQIMRTGHDSPAPTSSDILSQQMLSATTNVTTAGASYPTKKFSIEDYQRKRMESDLETPKVVTDSPALPSSANAALVAPGNDQLAVDGSRRMSILVTEPLSEGQTKYYREYNRYRTLAIGLKRKADNLTRIQQNPRLGALVYFLSGNAFMRAFHFNDRHFEALHAHSRPDIVLKESMKCWESMKQFSSALSVQCSDNRFPGLDGLSFLLEALVYFKCHSYANYRLRKEMQGIEQLRKRATAAADTSGSAKPVIITVDLATKLLQNAEDWANLTSKLDECEQALTPDIAREQFPETFNKWCIHPDDYGKSLSGRSRDGKEGFSMVVEQKQTVLVGLVDGVPVHEEKIRQFPKIMWPLSTRLHLSNLMDFAEEAVHEYQTRNRLECDISHLQ